MHDAQAKKERKVNQMSQILDAGKLSKNNRCSKMRARADLNLRGEKSPTMNKPMACREVVLDYLYHGLAITDVPAALAAKFKDVGYVKVVLFHELFSHLLWQLFFYTVAYKLSSKVCAASFVAKNVAK